MPRPYHSPSSIKLAQRCEYAWALCYIEGLRTPGTPATALGTDGHAVLEAWYENCEPDWQSFPGQVMHAGAHLLPSPSECELVCVETPIGDVPIVNPDASGPQVVREIDGVRWAGFKDLVAVPTSKEAERLGLPRGRAVLFDYKTSSSIARYALTRVELAADLQANLYAYDTALEFGEADTPARWVYFETKRVRRAKAVDVTIHRDDALRVIDPCNTLARELDSLTDTKAATKNPHACGDYGGCKYHTSRGGPCDARRSIGGLIQARVKKGTDMANLADLKNRFNKAKTEAPAEADAPEATEGDAPEDKPAPKAPAAAKASPAAKPSKLAKLVGDLEAAESKVDAIKSEIKAALG